MGKEIFKEILRSINQKEKAFIAKWTVEWSLPFEIIEKAFEIMVSAIERPTLAYENGILEKWREAGCKTIEDVEGLIASQKKAPKKQDNRESSFDLDEFFEAVNESGSSSFKYLQNVYTVENVSEQGLSLALCLAQNYLKDKPAAFRVHGGGFAGTIQAYVPSNDVDGFKSIMDSAFGDGACIVLRIRPEGALRVF